MSFAHSYVGSILNIFLYIESRGDLGQLSQETYSITQMLFSSSGFIWWFFINVWLSHLYWVIIWVNYSYKVVLGLIYGSVERPVAGLNDHEEHWPQKAELNPTTAHRHKPNHTATIPRVLVVTHTTSSLTLETSHLNTQVKHSLYVLRI